MKRQAVTEKRVRDPQQLTAIINELLDGQYQLLAADGQARAAMTAMSKNYAGLTDEERDLLRSLSIGSVSNPVAAQRPVVPSVTTKPPTASSTPGEMIRLTTDGLVYIFVSATTGWVPIGAAAPANMQTTDTAQAVSGLKTYSANNIHNGNEDFNGNNTFDGTNIFSKTVTLSPGSGDALNVTAGLIASATQYRCSVFHNAAQAIADATLSGLTLNSESFDIGTLHDTAVNNTRITCPRAGLWFLKAQVTYAAAVNGIRALHIYRNGVTVESRTQVVNAGAADQVAVESSCLVTVAAADYFEAVALQTSGGALNTVASSAIFAAALLWAT